MSTDLLNLLERLAKAGVDFVLVGGMAGVVHGCTYVTQDTDICCKFSIENLLTLQKALMDINPVHRMTPKKIALDLTEQTVGQFKNLYLDTDIGQLDCLSIIEGLGDYEQVERVSEIIMVGNIKIHVLNIDALIESKKAMNRHRDKEAIMELEAIKRLKKAAE